jgi:hypothetical protein
MMKHTVILCAVIALAFSLTTQTVEAATVNGSVSGTFGAFYASGSNLPEATYPYPDLINGGSFAGTFSFDSNAIKTLYTGTRFAYLAVDIDIKDKFGSLLHTIDTAPNGFASFSDGSLRLNFGESFGGDAIGNPEDLRLTFSGAFLNAAANPPSATAMNAATFDSGFVEVDGAVSSTFWDVWVDSATLQVPEPATASLLALGGLAVLRKRRKRRQV